MSTIAECYEELGGSYEEALGRLMKDSLIEKFIRKFPADDSYAQLQANLEEGNLEEAFRAVHTLKGVAYNLAFTRLGDAASDLTELLRPGNEGGGADTIAALNQAITEAYQTTIAAIEKLG